MKNILVSKQKENYFEEHLFLTYEGEGKKIYYLDGAVVDKESGNAAYKRLIDTYGKDYYKVTITPITIENREEIINKYLSRYDKYADYIDDPRQWKRVTDRNEMIKKCERALLRCVQ